MEMCVSWLLSQRVYWFLIGNWIAAGILGGYVNARFGFGSLYGYGAVVLLLIAGDVCEMARFIAIRLKLIERLIVDDQILNGAGTAARFGWLVLGILGAYGFLQDSAHGSIHFVVPVVAGWLFFFNAPLLVCDLLLLNKQFRRRVLTHYPYARSARRKKYRSR